MKTHDQNGDYSARMNYALSQPVKLLVVIFMLVFVMVVGQSAVEQYLPSVKMVELFYSHNIRAEVFYNPYNGIPHVDSSMSYSDLEFADYVDSVSWFVPDDARSYYIASIVQADSASIESYLNQIAEP